MGKIHKLKPEIKSFILEQKKANPASSCRNLASLVKDKFQVKLSKSSINGIIKQAGLSMPVGRRAKKRRQKLELPGQPQLEINVKELTQQVLLPEPAEALPELIKKPLEEVPAASVPQPAEQMPEKPVAEKPAEPIPEQPPQELPKEPAQATISVQQIVTEEPLPLESSCSGAILLKAADCLMGGSYRFAEDIRKRLKEYGSDLLAKTEALIYLGLFAPENIEQKTLESLWPLINRKISLDTITAYTDQLRQDKALIPDIRRLITNAANEVRCIKLVLANGETVYLDGQLHTVWSSPHTPYDLSAAIHNTKHYLNKYALGDTPFLLFMAPGYETPTLEFFKFLMGWEGILEGFVSLYLYGNKFEELEKVTLEQNKRRFFILGLWPWQFTGQRKIIHMGQFRPFHCQILEKDFFIADLELALTQPITKQSITLRGCVLKNAPSDKIRVLILSNFPAAVKTAEEVAQTYLSQWPNLEEAFQDLSRKIELYTYTANAQRFFSIDNLGLDLTPVPWDIKTLFDYYLRVLDLYIRWHFMPFGYEEKDFVFMKDNFYNLGASLTRQESRVLIKFPLPPAGFAFSKDLAYACRRLNQREIISSDGKRLWFTV